MKNINLYDTSYIKIAGIDKNVAKVAQFLAANRQLVLPRPLFERLVEGRPILETPINVFFGMLRDNDLLTKFFAPIVIPRGVSGVPELLLGNEITIDLGQIRDPGMFKNIPELFNKVVINMNSVLKISRTDTSNMSISDIATMHSLFVRGALVISYAVDTGWLNPALCTFIVKSYSMILSSIVARTFQLTLIEQMHVAAAFALFYCGKLETNDRDIPMLFNRCTFIGTNSQLDILATDIVKENGGKLETFSQACMAAAKLGPERMSKFSFEMFSRSVGPICSDYPSSYLALEYPPYFVHQLMVAMSNGKTGLFFALKNSRLIEETKRFLSDLASTNTFLSKLHNM